MADEIRGLDQFLTAYREDDNEWWATASGELMNHFDDLLDRLDRVQQIIDGPDYAEAKVALIEETLRG